MTEESIGRLIGLLGRIVLEKRPPEAGECLRELTSAGFTFDQIREEAKFSELREEKRRKYQAKAKAAGA